MTEQDKQLLLTDLCGRLPYGVFVNIEGFDYDFNGKLVQVYFGNINRCSIQVRSNISYSLEATKPWLRPMTSMTEEEYESVSWEGCFHTYNYSSKSGFRFVEIKTFTLDILNWLNAHHFDYRGLIEKGLALEAHKGMYKEEQ